jgi:hypothetical protein
MSDSRPVQDRAVITDAELRAKIAEALADPRAYVPAKLVFDRLEQKHAARGSMDR